MGVWWILGAVAALLLVDLAITLALRRVVALRIGEALGASVHIDARGWPASVRLPLGRLREVVVSGRDVPLGDATLERLEVRLTGVRPERGADGLTIAASGGSFSAWLDADGFTDLAPIPSSVLGVSLEPGHVRFELPGGVATDAALEIEEGLVVLRPEVERLGILSVLRFAFPLQELPFGATAGSVHVLDGRLRVDGSLGRVRLDRP